MLALLKICVTSWQIVLKCPRRQAIDRSLYDAAKDLGTYVEAMTIPFPMSGANTQDRFNNYGTDVGDTKSWSGKRRLKQTITTGNLLDNNLSQLHTTKPKPLD